MRKVWVAIRPIALPVVAAVFFLLLLLGLPLAVVVALLFRRRFLSSPLPGKLGCEDLLRRFSRLSAVCGLVTALLLGSGLLLAYWLAPRN